MADYSIVKKGKLKLKGESLKSSKPKKRKTTKLTSEEYQAKKAKEADTSLHGGWSSLENLELVIGSIAIEFGNQMYMKALDDGLFTIGAPHGDEEPPSPEEIFSAFRVNEDKIAIKSGYGKFIKVDKNGEVVGRSDAAGANELWEPIFQDKKVALLSSNGYFMSVNPDDDSIVAKNKKVGPHEICQLRAQIDTSSQKSDVPEDEKGNISQIEINYVKKFQKFQDKRMRLCPEDTEKVSKAKEEGTLHETLLDRRSKMKADRYCK